MVHHITGRDTEEKNLSLMMQTIQWDYINGMEAFDYSFQTKFNWNKNWMHP